MPIEHWLREEAVGSRIQLTSHSHHFIAQGEAVWIEDGVDTNIGAMALEGVDPTPLSQPPLVGTDLLKRKPGAGDQASFVLGAS